MLEAGAPFPFAQVAGAQFDNARLERLRGLKFNKPVPVVAMKPEDAQHIIEADLKRDYSDERYPGIFKSGGAMGWGPHGDSEAG